MIKTPDGPAVVTNIHVIANNPNLKITTNTGALVPVLSEKGASDRDLALLAIKDAHYSYLEMAADISQTVQPGDEVITPGNSEGGEVMLNTDGKVLDRNGLSSTIRSITATAAARSFTSKAARSSEW
jgi:S1-C subfamily serine protease